MFKCEQCRTQSRRGEPSRKVVVEERARKYRGESDGNKSGAVTEGKEIVREMKMCVPCAEANNRS